MSDSLRPHGLQPTRLPHPWDFPGKSTGVGCHCLLRDEFQMPQMTCARVLRHVQLMDCSPPGSSVHGDSPGRNTGVGCHFLLQCVRVKRESEVAQSCPTLSDPMDCSLPGSSIHGVFQARVLEWGTIVFSTCFLEFLKSTRSQTRLSDFYFHKGYIEGKKKN